ncbi:hypothetical protein Leryth_003120 [Lithospermum erythrorhizon]|nr:hypothetical protein Leryth_003120 [Lithospermum erythrorhizon]
MEWGNFKSSHLPLSEYDHALDAEKWLKKQPCLVKRSHELRLICFKVTIILGTYHSKTSIAFVDKYHANQDLREAILTSKCETSRTPEMSAMHHDTSSDLRVVGDKLKNILKAPSTSVKTRRLVVELCNIIATRGSRLAAAGMLGILKKLGKDTVKEGTPERTVIAMDGGLYEHYTEYSKCLENTLKELLGEELSAHVEMVHSNDGSGIGASLLAASNSIYLNEAS